MNLPTSKYIEIKVNLIILVIINKTLKMSTPKNNYLRMLEETRQDSYKQLLPIIYEKLNSRQQGIPNYNLTPKTIYSQRVQFQKNIQKNFQTSPPLPPDPGS